MYLWISRNGQHRQAVLMAAGETRLRLAVENDSDAIDLTLKDGTWFDETGAPVSLDAFVLLTDPVPARCLAAAN